MVAGAITVPSLTHETLRAATPLLLLVPVEENGSRPANADVLLGRQAGTAKSQGVIHGVMVLLITSRRPLTAKIIA